MSDYLLTGDPTHLELVFQFGKALLPGCNQGSLVLPVPVVLLHREEGAAVAKVQPDVVQTEVVWKSSRILHYSEPFEMGGSAYHCLKVNPKPDSGFAADRQSANLSDEPLEDVGATAHLVFFDHTYSVYFVWKSSWQPLVLALDPFSLLDLTAAFRASDPGKGG